ncbi:unnamed protein product, partial [marine sediment metagenome]
IRLFNIIYKLIGRKMKRKKIILFILNFGLFYRGIFNVDIGK